MNNVTPQLTALVLGTVAIVGSSIAVCLGHIDPSTYVAIVAAFGGIGVGAGVNHAGTVTGAQVANGKPTA